MDNRTSVIVYRNKYCYLAFKHTITSKYWYEDLKTIEMYFMYAVTIKRAAIFMLLRKLCLTRSAEFNLYTTGINVLCASSKVHC